MRHSNTIPLRSIFLLWMVCLTILPLSAVDQWTTMPMQSVNTMQTGVKPLYTSTASLRKGMMSSAPITTMGATSAYSPGTMSHSGRSTTVLGRTADMTLHNINSSVPVMRRLGGGDNDDDDDWGDDPGSGAGGGSSGQPETPIVSALTLLIFAGVYFAVIARKKRRKARVESQETRAKSQELRETTNTNYSPTHHPQTTQSTSTSRPIATNPMKKIASILLLLSLALSAMAYDTAVEGTDYYSPDFHAKGLSDGTVAIVSWYVSSGTTIVFPSVLYTTDEKAYEVSQVGWFDGTYYWQLWGEGSAVNRNAVTTLFLSEGIKYFAGRMEGFTALTTIILPSTLTEFKNFHANGAQRSWVSNLTSIYCAGDTPPTIGADIFDGQYTNAKVYVRAGARDTYRSATGWKKFKDGGTWRVESKDAYAITYNHGTNGTGTIETGYKFNGVTYYLSNKRFTYSGVGGATQIGWSLTDGGAKSYDFLEAYTSNAALTVYPTWLVKTYYSIVYNKGAYGIGMIASQSKAQDVSVTLSSQKFSRAGYIQTGWSTTDGGAKVYNLGATYTANASVILYPYWEEDTSTKYYLRGTMFDTDPWGTTEGQMINNGNGIYSLSIYLDIDNNDWIRNFQIYCPSTGKWWGLTYDYALTFDATQVTLTEDGTSRNESHDANLRACESATYTFTFNPANGLLTVTFPPTRYYLTGSGDLLHTWAPDGIEFMGTGTTRIAYLDVPSDEGNHSFKITKLNGYCDTYTWYGNNGTISASTATPWDFRTDRGNCTFNPECAGTYKFILDISTPATPKLSVEFPEGNANQYYVTGSWCDWELRDEYLLENVNDKVSIPLAASTTYSFYLVNSCSGRTYSHATAVTNTINNRTYSASETPCTLTTAAFGGEYVFELNATTPTISIYYPTQSDFYLAGSFNSWATNNAAYRFSKNSNGSNKYVLGAPLPGCEYHEMKVVNGGTWYGDKTYTTAHIMYSVNNWQASSDGSNWGITTQKEDIYKFTFDDGANPKTLSVAYPSPYYALMGTFNDWSRCSHVFLDNAIITADLEANTEYRMQIISPEGIWGIERYSGLESPTHLVVSSEYNVATTQGTVEDPSGFAMVTTVAGTYSFAFDYTTHQLTIIYPDVELINLCLGTSYELPHGYTYSGDIAYVHENRFFGTESGQYTVEGVNQADLSHVAYTFAVGVCPYDYRIQSNTTYGTFYSNIVGTTSDSLSLYVHPSGTCYWQRSDHGANDWTTGINNIQSGKGISEAGIYHTVFTSLIDGTDITGTWKPYNGDLYVYDATPASIATFEGITPDRSNANEYFDHTVVMRGSNSASTTGVTMGDEINTCISYADGRYSAETPATNDFVRYIYNASDNHFQRTILKYNTSKYLYIHGSAPSQDANDFTYLGDNKFEADFRANANCNIQLIAKNGSTSQYLLYKTAVAGDVLKVVGSVSPSGTLDMHMYYDFRTNKLLYGWMPNNYTAAETGTIETNLLIRRTNNTLNPATPFKSTYSGNITITGKTYFIQQFTSDLSSALADKYFYFTLPYAASMSDVFGMEDMEYKTNYTVQRYRGDKRAQNGDAYMDSPGYWANLKQTTALEAGRGYEIGIDAITYPTDQNAPSPSTRRLFFPSASTGFVVKAPKDYPSTVIAANPVSSGIDEAAHANWNVVGTPGLVAVTPYRSTNFSFTGLNGNTSPNYLYTWNGEYNDFTVQNYQTFTFQPMMSYFMQYVGTIQWGSASTPAAVRARAPKSGDRVICDLYEVSLSNTYGEEEDKTYVSFSSDGANTFEQHRDLYKILTANHAQIYSAGVLSGTEKNAFAAQDVERDVVVEVPLTLTLENGEYTISLTNVLTTEATPTPLYLYDAATDTRACLTDGQIYTFQSNGTVLGRFFLRLYSSGGSNVTTDMESVLENAESTVNGKYIRDGKLYIRHAGNTYDATGLRL